MNSLEIPTFRCRVVLLAILVVCFCAPSWTEVVAGDREVVLTGEPEEAEGTLAAEGAAPLWETLLIENVTLISPERPGPVVDAWVAIQGNRIADVGTGEPPTETNNWRRLSGQGRYLIPGLIDGHVHLGSVPGMAPKQQGQNRKLVVGYFEQLPRSYLYYGFTTLVDLAPRDPGALQQFRGLPQAPDVFGCGRAAPIANGYPMVFVPPRFRFKAYSNFLIDPNQTENIPKSIAAEDHSPEAVARRALEDGGLCVKTFVEDGFGLARDWPVPSASLLRQLGEASSALGLVLAVHANSLDSYNLALDSGAFAASDGVLVHGLWTWDAVQQEDDGETLPSALRSIVERVAESGPAVMPTLQVLAGDRALFEPNFLSDPALKSVVPPALLAWYGSDAGQWFAQQLLSGLPAEIATPQGAYASYSRAISRGDRVARALVESGAKLLFGSDTPSGPSYGNAPGYNGYLELQRLAAIGMPLDQLLAAATLENARAFGFEDRFGSIEVGKVANLLLLRANPLDSPLAYGELETVILRGAIVGREDLAADRP